MQPAGQDMDDSVRGLGRSQVATRFRMGGIHFEETRSGAPVQETVLSVRQEFAHRPGLALIIRKGDIDSIAFRTPEIHPLLR